MNVQQKQQKGFTIIEVILVLAIAGLIFLMVFLALPALQRGQRNTQRKQDLSRVLSQLQNFQSNSQGSLPTTSPDQWNGALMTQYLRTNGDQFTDPSGTAYTFTLRSAPANATYSGSAAPIYVTVGAICSGGGVTTGQGAKKVAVQMALEGSGLACENN